MERCNLWVIFISTFNNEMDGFCIKISALKDHLLTKDNNMIYYSYPSHLKSVCWNSTRDQACVLQLTTAWRPMMTSYSWNVIQGGQRGYG